jgi:hypothetical protein
MSNNLDWSLLIPVDDLKNFFDMVDVSDNFLEFLHDDCLLDNPFNFLYGFVLVLDLNNLFVLPDNLLYLFNNDWDLDYFLDDLLDVSVNVDQLRENSFYFNNLGNLNDNLFGSFHFMNLGNSDRLFDNFFDYLLGRYYLLNNRLDWHDFFSFYDHFLDFLVDIRNLLGHLFDSLVNHNFLLNPQYFMDSHLFGSLSYNFFDDLWHLDDLLDNFC